MRQFLVFISVVAFAYAESNSQNEVVGPIECALSRTTMAINESFNGFVVYLKSVSPVDSAKQTIAKLRNERDTLNGAITDIGKQSNVDLLECVEKAKEQGGLFPNTRCTVTTKARFAINAGKAVGSYSVKVAKILVNDNVAFHGENLTNALKVGREQISTIIRGISESMQCFVSHE